MTNAARSKNVEIVVYIGLGSNLGDREANLRQAIEHIAALGIEIRKESSVYETEPVGFSDQPWFLNQVIETANHSVLTSEHGPVLGDPDTTATIQAEAFLSELLEIEHKMGRERLIANGPRVIDLDLLLFGDAVIAHTKDDEGWQYIDPTDIFVPHRRMHLRRFVLVPLCEIAPEVVHPLLKKKSREILDQLDVESAVRIYSQR